jgi:hypothetical protein
LKSPCEISLPGKKWQQIFDIIFAMCRSLAASKKLNIFPSHKQFLVAIEKGKQRDIVAHIGALSGGGPQEETKIIGRRLEKTDSRQIYVDAFITISPVFLVARRFIINYLALCLDAYNGKKN